MTNYLPDQNRFALAGPPDWWLRQLAVFDDSLVVIPSRQGFYYRLAQKRPPNLPVHITNEALFKESDTRMLASYGLIPVTTILATANWSNPVLFEELRRRAPHRNGGAQVCADRLDATEAEEERRKAAQTDANLTDVSKDAWGMYLKKIGVRSHMWIPKSR